MKVAVGCPIRNRAWIFPQWVEHVRAAFQVAHLEPTWVFNIAVEPEDDDNTFKLVTDLFKNEPGMWCVQEEKTQLRRNRVWNEDRYHQMVAARNHLLGLVRAIRPDYFLSVDSDILLHPQGLECLLADLREWHSFPGLEAPPAAAGGKAYLSSSVSHPCPTYGNLLGWGGLVDRQDSEGTFPVDAIMAIKLMSPAAYQIDYEFSVHGEDLGWSRACKEAGLKLIWDGSVCSKHVMDPKQLDQIDPRLGW